jgi:hypothetical protein
VLTVLTVRTVRTVLSRLPRIDNSKDHQPTSIQIDIILDKCSD